ncbi:phosphatase PAP2 family protein [Streptomyces sp. NPDC057638]|uniref:phosphatase PAP2 family protein n=1 Tax=Streptomyces sp. NPDC057638 TaxID=3346190 RepID=UPI00368FCDE5
MALAVTWRKIAATALARVLLMAFSRVFVGVRHPHDVAVGVLLGAFVALAFMTALTRLTTRLVITVRRSGVDPPAWITGPEPAHAPRPGLRPTS